MNLSGFNMAAGLGFWGSCFSRLPLFPGPQSTHITVNEQMTT